MGEDELLVVSRREVAQEISKAAAQGLRLLALAPAQMEPWPDGTKIEVTEYILIFERAGLSEGEA